MRQSHNNGRAGNTKRLIEHIEEVKIRVNRYISILNICIPRSNAHWNLTRVLRLRRRKNPPTTSSSPSTQPSPITSHPTRLSSSSRRMAARNATRRLCCRKQRWWLHRRQHHQRMGSWWKMDCRRIVPPTICRTTIPLTCWCRQQWCWTTKKRASKVCCVLNSRFRVQSVFWVILIIKETFVKQNKSRHQYYN